MVLSELADLIYNVFLLLYYTVKLCVFIGFVLYDALFRISSTLLWALQNVNAFISIVCEDNQHLFRDVTNIIAGTSHFFIDNINKVYNAVCAMVSMSQEAIISVFSMSVLILNMCKEGVILVGEAVWFLFTDPYQLKVGLEHLITHGMDQLVQTATKTLSEWKSSVNSFAIYTAQNFPFEAICGLSVLLLGALNPTITKFVITCFYNLICDLNWHMRRIIQQRIHQMCGCIIRAARVIFAGICHLYTMSIRIYDTEFYPIFITIANMFTLRSHEEITETEAERHVEQIPHRSTVSVFLHRIASIRYAAVLYSLRNIFNFNASRTAQYAEPTEHASPHKTVPRATIGTCIICEDNDRCIAFVPCGHLCVCRLCAIHLCHYNSQCPLCRSAIVTRLEVYI